MAATGQEAVALEQLRTWGVAISGEIDKKVDSPAASGTAGQVLSTNGTATEWIDPPEGTVYSGTAPITVSGSVIGITAASSSAAGSMSAADKAKLDGIAANANNYELPIASATALGGVLALPEASISGSLVRIMNGSDTRADPGKDQPNGTLFVKRATTTEDGAMSLSDKAKLDGIAENANNYTLPAASETTLGGVKFASDTDFNAYMGIS